MTSSKDRVGSKFCSRTLPATLLSSSSSTPRVAEGTNMNADQYDVAARLSASSVPTEQSRHVARGWSVITVLIALAVLFEAIFAGAMLSGVEWARRAHAVNAGVLIASAL